MRATPKTVMRCLDTQATAGETNTTIVDRLGYDYAVLDIGLIGIETNVTPTELKLQEANDTNATSFANISGLVGGTDFTIPATIATLGAANPTIVQMRVDLRARKRYLRLSIAAGTKTLEMLDVQMHNAKEGPITATNAGVDLLVSV